MEEFRSTEILDKEIQEDARRKAERLLRNAQSDGQRIIDESAARFEKTRAEKEAQYSKRIETRKADLDAALPLEKARFLVSFVDESVNKAVNAYVAGLPEIKKAELLKKLLERYRSVIEQSEVTVCYHGLSEKMVHDLLDGVFPKERLKSVSAYTDAQAAADGITDGMIIQSVDGFRCRVAIDELMGELLDAKRFELSNALFCGRLEQ